MHDRDLSQCHSSGEFYQVTPHPPVWELQRNCCILWLWIHFNAHDCRVVGVVSPCVLTNAASDVDVLSQSKPPQHRSFLASQTKRRGGGNWPQSQLKTQPRICRSWCDLIRNTQVVHYMPRVVFSQVTFLRKKSLLAGKAETSWPNQWHRKSFMLGPPGKKIRPVTVSAFQLVVNWSKIVSFPKATLLFERQSALLSKQKDVIKVNCGISCFNWYQPKIGSALRFVCDTVLSSGLDTPVITRRR